MMGVVEHLENFRLPNRVTAWFPMTNVIHTRHPFSLVFPNDQPQAATGDSNQLLAVSPGCSRTFPPLCMALGTACPVPRGGLGSQTVLVGYRRGLFP